MRHGLTCILLLILLIAGGCSWPPDEGRLAKTFEEYRPALNDLIEEFDRVDLIKVVRQPGGFLTASKNHDDRRSIDAAVGFENLLPLMENAGIWLLYKGEFHVRLDPLISVGRASKYSVQYYYIRKETALILCSTRTQELLAEACFVALGDGWWMAYSPISSTD